MNAMKIFTIAGWSGSGKTLLITRLIERFKARNRQVVAVKHAPDIDWCSLRARTAAGFSEPAPTSSLLMAQNELTRIPDSGDRDDRFSLLTSCFQDDDIVLMEGFSSGGDAGHRSDRYPHQPESRLPVERLAAVICDSAAPAADPLFFHKRRRSHRRFYGGIR